MTPDEERACYERCAFHVESCLDDSDPMLTLDEIAAAIRYLQTQLVEYDKTAKIGSDTIQNLMAQLEAANAETLTVCQARDREWTRAEAERKARERVEGLHKGLMQEKERQLEEAEHNARAAHSLKDLALDLKETAEADARELWYVLKHYPDGYSMPLIEKHRTKYGSKT